MITNFHSKLYAHELLRRCPSDSVERFTATLFDSKVDLNPHQIDAALFAFRSPLSKGAIMADEVGLGKTIEAGIVLSQKWAERKRKILIILPSNLRKQWYQELQDKFYLPSEILEARTFNKAIKEGKQNPFDRSDIVLCSYYFARNKSEYIQAINWDLVVIDEAHRLRNVYKTGNKIARELKAALSHAPKLLLTATPLQNSLLELYGLVSFIDDLTFGDLKSFRSQYGRITSATSFDELKARLKPVCQRTLRRQVLEYIRYTARIALTQEFVPSEEEDFLYDLVSDYLRRPNLQALPPGQRTLMTLVLRKLLASSTFAIAGALDSLANKLEKMLKDDDKLVLQNVIEEDFETYTELADELIEDEEEENFVPLTTEERELIKEEIEELRSFFQLAMEITENAKGNALLQALDAGFNKAVQLGGAQKVVIFTEFRRTQDYLFQLLSRNGYKDSVVLFNGSNNDLKSREIYAAWKNKFAGTDMVTGSRTADIRAAIVDNFREHAQVMVATEAAAEGINLQFCSFVVNYDLPWNPQRVEQRIGRCHRYGQKHDVVVVNFLNKNNAADKRVFELLSEKFRLFDGVFGASDEILGSIESGVDFERRIVEIYQTCRSQEEITASFDALQDELSVEIDANMKSTRQKLLENFDTEVAEKLSVYKEKATASLNKYEALLWDTTIHHLGDQATFDEASLTFNLNVAPAPAIPTGLYTLKRSDDTGHHYRLQHPLARFILTTAAQQSTGQAELIFDYSNTTRNIAIIEPLVGQTGILTATRLTVTALEAEDYIVLAAITEDGQELDPEQSRRLFNLPATVSQCDSIDSDPVQSVLIKREKSILADISARNALFFDEELDKLERWSDDKKQSLEIEIKDLDIAIKQKKTEARKLPGLDEKVKMQREVKSMEKKRTSLRRKLFDAQDQIDSQKEKLLDEVEARLQQHAEMEPLFTIRWQLI